MTKLVKIVFLFLAVSFANVNAFAQENKSSDVDIQYKESLYKMYKREVLAYNKKNFDDLFFEFFTKQNDNSITLTKEEFYTYTIKIAIYSEKLGLLYKDQKKESLMAKQEWFNKKYQDYLDAKK